MVAPSRDPVTLRSAENVADLANPTYVGAPPYSGAWNGASYDPERPPQAAPGGLYSTDQIKVDVALVDVVRAWSKEVIRSGVTDEAALLQFSLEWFRQRAEQSAAGAPRDLTPESRAQLAEGEAAAAGRHAAEEKAPLAVAGLTLEAGEGTRLQAEEAKRGQVPRAEETEEAERTREVEAEAEARRAKEEEVASQAREAALALGAAKAEAEAAAEAAKLAAYLAATLAEEEAARVAESTASANAAGVVDDAGGETPAAAKSASSFNFAEGTFMFG